MQILNNRLVLDEGSAIDYKYASAGKWAPVIEPEVLVIHYGVTTNLNTLVAAQRESGYWAHLSIDGYTEGARGGVYHIRQHLDFNRKGSHAGPSHWNGRDSVNDVSVGIEISNPGPLIEKAGRLYTVHGQEWDRDQAVQLRHDIKACGYEWWAIYTDQEIDLLVEFSHLFVEQLGFRDIVGHDEIATPRGRKIDPGPAMPTRWLRKRMFGRENMLNEAA